MLWTSPFFGCAIVCGIVILVAFSLRWIRASIKRLRQIRLLQSSSNGSDVNLALAWQAAKRERREDEGSDASLLGPLPSVTVVMPVKMECIKTKEPKMNWKTQILSGYPGTTESIFVVESEDDGVVKLLGELQEEMPEIKVVVAGLSRSCTQKIHNMLAGVQAASSEYVLFLDANCRLHPSSLEDMMKEFLSDPDVMIATGYPLDIPPKCSSVMSWAMCQFRFFNISELCHSRSDVIWGGAMLMRTSDFKDNNCNLQTAWLDGGYSDDMLAASCVREGGRTVATPIRALFPNVLKGDVNFCGAWNFLHRQMFVLNTYFSSYGFWKNKFLMFAYGFGWSLAAFGFLSSAFVLVSVGLWGNGPDSAVKTFNFVFACVFFLVLFLTIFVEKRHLQIAVQMTTLLSPGAPFANLHISFVMLLTSFVVHSHMAPLIAVAAFCKYSGVWGGIKYHVRGGKICQINRPGCEPIQVQPGASIENSPDFRILQPSDFRRFMTLLESP